MSKVLHREYWEIDGKLIRVSLSFNKDPYNWATSQPKKIGYQVTCTPIKKSNSGGIVIEEFEAFTGFYDCISEVSRQSKKRLEEVIKLLQTKKETYLNYFRKEKAVENM